MSQSPPSAELLEITEDELSWMENADNHAFITPSQVSRLVTEVRDMCAENEHLVEDLDAMRDERDEARDELEGLNQIHELCWEGEPRVARAKSKRGTDENQGHVQADPTSEN